MRDALLGLIAYLLAGVLYCLIWMRRTDGRPNIDGGAWIIPVVLWPVALVFEVFDRIGYPSGWLYAYRAKHRSPE